MDMVPTEYYITLFLQIQRRAMSLSVHEYIISMAAIFKDVILELKMSPPCLRNENHNVVYVCVPVVSATLTGSKSSAVLPIRHILLILFPVDEVKS